MLGSDIQTDSASGPETRSSHLIYLADPDSAHAESVAEQIRFFGYRVLVLNTYSSLLKALETVAPAVAVVDMALVPDQSEMSSENPGENIKTAEPVPLIFLSTNLELNTRLKAVRAGGRAFFSYPVNVAALIDALDQIAWFVPPAPMRVLVVEDTNVNPNFNAISLKKAGIITEVLNGPAKVLHFLEEFQPELMLLDMYMSSCTGMELASIIRQIPAYVSTPIVYLSSETDRDRQLEAVSLGGDDFLVKPIKPEHLISAVVSRIQRYRSLRELMLRDSLTGLYNHTTIKEHLRQEFARAKRTNYPLSCVVIDLDHFKDINDTYGHTTGDRVLKSLAQLLIRRLRQADIVGRFGGEEFVVVLPGTEAVAAVRIFDKLRVNFSQIRHLGWEGEFTLTFSVGVAGCPPYSSPGMLFELADRALYVAKTHGRNQVSMAN